MRTVDVMPTVLDILGIAIPGSVQGRVLREALVAYLDEPVAQASHETITAEGAAGHLAHLSLSRVGTTTYLDRGWVD